MAANCFRRSVLLPNGSPSVRPVQSFPEVSRRRTKPLARSD